MSQGVDGGEVGSGSWRGKGLGLEKLVDNREGQHFRRQARRQLTAQPINYFPV